MPDKTAFPPLDPATWPDSISHLKDSFAGQLNVYRVMAHHPDLLAGWSSLRAHVVTENALSLEQLEIVILRVATRLGSDYEWSHHIARARKLGMSDARIFSMAGDMQAMAPEDRLLAEAVDDLLDHTKIAPERLENLVALVGKAGVFDLIATVGFYKTLGCITETFGMPFEDGVEVFNV